MTTPLHPFFTHFPIALLVVGLLFEIIGLLRKQPLFGEMSFWMLLGGAAGAALAVITGGWEEDKLKMSDALHEAVEQHETVGFLFAWLAAALFVWKLLRRAHMKANETRVFIGAYAVTVILMLYGGWLGGKLVYEYGAGVKGVTILETEKRSDPVQDPTTEQP